MATPYNDVEALEKAGFKTAKLVSQPTTSIQFHLKNPNVPWHDIRVRQAIAYAIDTQGDRQRPAARHPGALSAAVARRDRL